MAGNGFCRRAERTGVHELARRKTRGIGVPCRNDYAADDRDDVRTGRADVDQ